MSMSEPAEKLYDVDAFLQWAAAREGKFELHDGRIVAMSPERVRHAGAKGETFATLRDVMRRASLPCRAYLDGIAVRAHRASAFVPDVLVACPTPSTSTIPSSSSRRRRPRPRRPTTA
jgi:Uma2 family endonuclease